MTTTVAGFAAASLLLFATACSSSGDVPPPPGGGGSDHGAGGSAGATASGGSTAGAGGGSTSGGASNGGAASGGTSNGGSGGAPELVAVDEAVSALALALCRHYRQCPGERHSAGLINALGDEARCAQRMVRYLNTGVRFGALMAGARAGKLRITRAALGACTEAAAMCSQPLRVAPDELEYDDVSPCRELFDGSVPAGGACNLSEECSGDAMCVPLRSDAGASAACTGTCSPRLVAGSSCTVDRECAGPAGSWPVCFEGACVVVEVEPPAALHERCGRYGIATTRPCAKDTWCEPIAPGLRVQCREFLDVGDACEGAQCIESVCLGGVCTALTVVTEGGDCGAERVCDAFDSLFCSEGKCVRAAGAACNPARWYTRVDCPRGTLAATGAPCGVHGSCESGVCGFLAGCRAGLCETR